MLLVALAVVVLAFTALAERLDFPAPLLLIAVGVAASYVPGRPGDPPRARGRAARAAAAAAVRRRDPDLARRLQRQPPRRSCCSRSAWSCSPPLGVGAVVHALMPGHLVAGRRSRSAPSSRRRTPSRRPRSRRRIGLPRRIVTILEGESLLNDATALVALRTAIAADRRWASSAVATSASTSWSPSVGGVLVGFVVFVVVAKLRKRITDPVLDTAISFVVPFAAYIAAEEIHASGVIAVVVAGLLLGHKAPILQTAQSRIAERMNWRTIAFVLENTVFLLIGLQARWILDDVGDEHPVAARASPRSAPPTLVGVIVLRMVWVFAARYLLVRPGPDPSTGRRPPWTLHLHPRLGRHARRGHAGRGVRDPGGHRRTARCCC